MMQIVLQYLIYLLILVGLAIPLGTYITKVMNGEKTFLSKVLTPAEEGIYRLLEIKDLEEMNWKKYAKSVIAFSTFGFVFLFLIQIFQGILPGNLQKLSNINWDLAFNTTASFVTNTNWQAYTGESTLSYLTQALGLTVQNFVSAATGIAVLFALIRGFVKCKTDQLQARLQLSRQERMAVDIWELIQLHYYIGCTLGVSCTNNHWSIAFCNRYCGNEQTESGECACNEWTCH